MQERLQKVLARAGIASRREAEKIIAAGRVKVNGRLADKLGGKADPDLDEITLDDNKISGQPKRYYLFNKPRGVVTTLRDPEGRASVGDYAGGLPERVFPVGRLDYYTEGLLLLTNDGELSQLLTHPRHQVKKTYKVSALGRIDEAGLDRLRAGVLLEDGLTAPATVDLLEYRQDKNLTVFTITIHEGRNRQVRRMCDAIGHTVRYLERITFAGLWLNGLKRGELRELTEKEAAALYAGARSDDEL